MTARVRFERHGRGASFVEVWREDRAVLRLHGKLGSDGTLRVEDHADALEAAHAVTRQLRSLENKRFVAGWHHPEMIRAIQANPASTGPYLVYADWLLERGDPRGELISKMAAGGDASALRANHPVQLEPSQWAANKWEPRWRLGFLEGMTVPVVADLGLVRKLLRHPSALVLQELIITRVNRLGPWAPVVGWEQALRDLPPTLNRLVVPQSADVPEPLVAALPALVRG